MVDFRRWITASAVFAVFAGLSSAQNVGTGTSTFTCVNNVSSTPVVRPEGFTELMGDIKLDCTGGSNTNLVEGSPIPTVNVQVFLSLPITSRLIGTSASGLISEALLIIDEPGTTATPATGAGTPFGAGAPQVVCPTPVTGCAEVVHLQPSLGITGSAITPGTIIPVPAVTGGGAVPNIFQGVVGGTGTSVTFFAVPVLPPGTTGITRTFRITNIRASVGGGGSAAPGGPILASIGVSNPTALPISTPTPIVAIVGNTLVTSSTAPTGGTIISQCTPVTKSSISLLKFTEGFGTAFKTRTAPTTVAFSGQANPWSATTPSVPGLGSNSAESGFIIPVLSTNTSQQFAGLADFGTRLKATFSGVPANVRLFVSVTNVVNGVLAATPPPLGIGSTDPTSFAELVVSENAVDGQSQFGSTSGLPGVTSTENAPGSTGGTVAVSEVLLSGGSGQAVWEVLNTNASIETLSFAVFATTTTSSTSTSPGAVTMSFAPTPGVAPQFSVAAAAAASGALPIPRFSGVTAATVPSLLNINVCRTILLYPFVTSSSGFDTGIAIANTSQDTFGTTGQTGSCVLNFFGGAAAPNSTMGPVAPGSVATSLVSNLAGQNFNGYLIATCGFQFAHGFAFVENGFGLAQGIGTVYLALVLPDPGPGLPGRSANPLGPAGSGEQVAH